MTPEFKKNLEFRIILLKDFYEHSKRSMMLVLTLIAGVGFFVVVPSIAVGEPRYINAAIVELGDPSTGGKEYLVVKTEEGRELIVKVLDTKKVGEEITLEVRDRLFLYGPTYKVYK